MNEEQIQDAAGRLQSASIRLLRMLRRQGAGSGITGARYSTLALLAQGGTRSLSDLAVAENVSAPTMSRVVDTLVRDGLATSEADPKNRRSVRIEATWEGGRLLRSGRDRQLRALTQRLERLADSEQRALARGVEILERVVR